MSTNNNVHIQTEQLFDQTSPSVWPSDAALDMIADAAEDSAISEHYIKEQVTKLASRNDITSWNRRMDKMVRLLADIRPIEEEIMQLVIQKQPIMDEVENLRQEMVTSCVHPWEYISVDKTTHLARCRFCEKQIKL